MISVNNVSVVFGGWYLLDGVSFLINKKEIHKLIFCDLVQLITVNNCKFSFYNPIKNDRS